MQGRIAMDLIRKIKDILPPSSRSFHQFREVEAQRFDQILNELCKHQAIMEDLINTRLDRLSDDLDIHDTHVKMLEWANFRQPNESLIDAKKRFFRELPPATGSARLVQLGCTHLLRAFNEICASKGLTYWAGGGTLIGAVRHNGFIPWDDDVDLAMTRKDLKILISVLATSSNYKISVLYDPFVICCQYRFMFKDDNVPCFLDIFPFDFANDANVKDKQSAIREELKQSTIANPAYQDWLEAGCIDETHPLFGQVKEMFANYIGNSIHEGLISFDKGKYLVRGIDNFDDPNGYHWSARIEDMFPLEWVKFEDTDIAIPQDAGLLLEGAYGDIYDIPRDIKSHFDHIAGSVSDQDLTDAAIEAKISGCSSH